MKPKELKKLAMQIFVLHMTELGYERDLSEPEDWFVKTLPNDIKIGIWPQFYKERGTLNLVFVFAARLPSFEQQLDLLDARIPQMDNWTFKVNNKNFPKHFRCIEVFDEGMGKILTTFPRHQSFSHDLTGEQVTERMNFLIKFVDEYSLPWLENLDEDSVCNEVKLIACLPGSAEEIKKLMAYVNVNDFSRVEEIISRSRANLESSPDVFETFLNTCIEKKRLLSRLE